MTDEQHGTSPDHQVGALPVDELMTDAELRTIREHLGLTTRWVADHLGVAERSVHRWESGERDVPDGVRRQIEQWEIDTATTIDRAVIRLMDLPDPAVATYRSDEHYRQHEPDALWPASWHRATIARIAERVPGLIIAYRD